MTFTIIPIKPKRISDQVFEQLRELIYRGKLKPGEKMMTERELADPFRVQLKPDGRIPSLEDPFYT